MPLERIFSTRDCIIDRYDSLAWATFFSDRTPPSELKDRLIKLKISDAVRVHRPKRGLPSSPLPWFGRPARTFTVIENGVWFEIRTDTFHPGLFLDHTLTRIWLKNQSKGKTVLNLFSYTGSLGIASAKGDASHSINIDLSNQATIWAKTNALLNQLGPQHQFIKGDSFDWLKRFHRQEKTFDIIISDPPSQSHSSKFHFSTEKHLDLLHDYCVKCLSPGGILVTSINTEKVSQTALVKSVESACKKNDRKLIHLEFLPLPPGFDPGFRSMKGVRCWV